MKCVFCGQDADDNGLNRCGPCEDVKVKILLLFVADILKNSGGPGWMDDVNRDAVAITRIIMAPETPDPEMEYGVGKNP